MKRWKLLPTNLFLISSTNIWPKIFHPMFLFIGQLSLVPVGRNEPFYWVILADIVLGYILSLSLLYNNEPNVNSLGTWMVMALFIFQHYRFSHLIIRSINIQDLKFAFLINIFKSCLRYKDNISFGFGFNNPTILKTWTVE